MPEPTAHPSRTPSEHRPALPAPPGRTLLLISMALFSSWGLTGWMESSGPPEFTGHLQAHTTTIAAQCDARIAEIQVEPGQIVDIGDPVMALSNEQLESQWKSQKRKVIALQAELDQVRAKADVELQQRTDTVNTAIFSTQLKISTLFKGQLAARMESLAWQGFLQDYNAVASAADSDDVVDSLVYDVGRPDDMRITTMLKQDAARNAEEVYSAQIELCEERLEELSRLKSELSEKIRRAMGVVLAETRLAQAQEELTQLEERIDKLAIATPAYGKVGVFRKQAGDRVETGEPVVDILDEDRRFLTANIPSSYINLFREGAEVALRFPGGQERQGRIEDISPQALPNATASGDVRTTSMAVAVRILPAGRLWPQLPVGSAVQVIPKQ